jgi:hypothetical protein
MLVLLRMCGSEQAPFRALFQPSCYQQSLCAKPRQHLSGDCAVPPVSSTWLIYLNKVCLEDDAQCALSDRRTSAAHVEKCRKDNKTPDPSSSRLQLNTTAAMLGCSKTSSSWWQVLRRCIPTLMSYHVISTHENSDARSAACGAHPTPRLCTRLAAAQVGGAVVM